MVGITACEGGTKNGTASAEIVKASDQPSAQAPAPVAAQAPAPAPAPVQIDPYSSTGTWMVPQEILPGTYRAMIADGENTGYYATCADYACEIEFDSDGGLISNDFMTGPGIIVIPPNAVSVELRDLVLTPMG